MPGDTPQGGARGGSFLVEVTSYLEGVPLPTEKEALVRYAQQAGAGSEVLRALEELPGDRRYHNLAEVVAHIGEDAGVPENPGCISEMSGGSLGGAYGTVAHRGDEEDGGG